MNDKSADATTKHARPNAGDANLERRATRAQTSPYLSGFRHAFHHAERVLQPEGIAASATFVPAETQT